VTEPPPMSGAAVFGSASPALSFIDMGAFPFLAVGRSDGVLANLYRSIYIYPYRRARNFILIDQKIRGRPRSFDAEAALDAALDLFWREGFEGASLRDLTAAMGVKGPSLYAAFGDKRALFLKAMERYGETAGAAPLRAFDAEPDIQAAVAAFLTTGFTSDASDMLGRGCFFSASAVASAGVVDGVSERLADAVAATEAHLAQRFDDEAATGRLRGDFPSVQRARMLLDMRQGMVFRARSGAAIAAAVADAPTRAAELLA